MSSQPNFVAFLEWEYYSVCARFHLSARIVMGLGVRPYDSIDNQSGFNIASWLADDNIGEPVGAGVRTGKFPSVAVISVTDVGVCPVQFNNLVLKNMQGVD